MGRQVNKYTFFQYPKEKKMKGLLNSRLNEENIPGTQSRAKGKALEWEVESRTEGRGEEIEMSRWCLVLAPRAPGMG